MMNYNAQLPYEKNAGKWFATSLTRQSRAHHPASHISVCH